MAELLEGRGQVIHITAADAVNDPGLTVVPFEHFEDLLHLLAPRQHAVGQVGPVEVADEHRRRAQAELVDDVLAHALRGRGRIRMNGCVGKQGTQLVELAIFRAKIMSPVADAVGLINGEGADADLPQQRLEGGHDEAFGRDEQQANLAVAHFHFGAEALVAGLGAVNHGRGDAVGAQAVDLVFHQRNERRDDDGCFLAMHRGSLVAERLAATGGQDDERIAAIEDGTHGLLLQGAQRAEAPGAGDGLFQVVDHGESSSDVSACGVAGSLLPAEDGVLLVDELPPASGSPAAGGGVMISASLVRMVSISRSGTLPLYSRMFASVISTYHEQAATLGLRSPVFGCRFACHGRGTQSCGRGVGKVPVMATTRKG